MLKVIQSTARLIVRSFTDYPARAATAIAAIVLAGFAESIGLVTLLPLLQFVLQADGGGSAGKLTSYVTELAHFFNLTPSLGFMLSIIVIATSIKAVMTLIGMSHIGFVVAHITTDLRLKLIRALLGASWSYFTNEAAGRIGNAISTEASRASSAYMASWQMVASTLQVVILLAAVVVMSWQLTTAAIVIGIVIALTLGWTMRLARQAGQSQTRLLNSLVSRLTEFMQGIKPIKAMALEGRVGPLLEDETQGLNSAQRTETVAATALGVLPEPILTIVLALGLFFAIQYWSIPITELMVFALIFNRSASRFAQVQKFMQSVLSTESAYWSLVSAIDIAEHSKEREGGAPPPELKTSIALKNVNFSYHEKAILQDVSIDIEAGQLTAFVGPSGGGKTTVVDLIVGLLTPSSGEIRIDGVSLRGVDLKAWRQMIGYVPQEPFLFHDTVERNVTLGDPDIGHSAVIAALNAADAMGFVEHLENGIQTKIGERGMKLSGGQRQRLAIARALVRNPKLLILDEATTALDPETELDICQTLRKLAGKLTILAISHQPAIVSVADKVYRVSDRNFTEERPQVGARVMRS
jgi:ATP-binding cassette subfamily C protein